MESITVTFKYLINFSEKTGKKKEDVSFDEGADLNAAAQWIFNAYAIEAPSKNMLALLNGHGWGQYPEKMGKKLKNGDVIILMPNISGG